ncbi:MAG TPA: sugar ABC transporter substrate-binding protein, partial [Opitutus sp.]|nr:sugar ABC transporter substrate-binding protein [Opitutus sp.]
MRKPRLRFSLLFLAALALASGAAGGREQSAAGAPAPVIRVWCHQGQEAENRAMRAIAADFNRAHRAAGVRVALTFFPDFQYTEKIAIAAAAHDLPDAFDLDGPLVARFVDADLLVPLDRWFTPDELADFLPTIRAQGTIDGRLYALGAFDSAVVLYYDRAYFARAGVAPPPDGRAWTWSEFLAACARLQAAGIRPVAMHMNETADEWFTYAFSPVVWSAGGALIGPDGRSVRGVLDAPVNVAALRAWQEVFQKGYALTDPVDPDPFDDGQTAMDWSGHWMARTHVEKKGAQLGAMPLPRIGAQPVGPCGSWCWGLATQARDPDRAALWIKWVTSTRHGIVPIVRANGAVPARRSAFAFFPEYRHTPYRVFRDALEHFARPRPRTP